MNSNGKASTWANAFLPKLLGTGVAKLAFALVGLPLAAAIIALLLLPERDHTPTYQRLANAQYWVEPLPANTPFTYAGLQAISAQQPDLSKVACLSLQCRRPLRCLWGRQKAPTKK